MSFPTRRQLIKTAVSAGGLGLLAEASGARVALADGARQPNVLFILADDLGFADLSCYGARAYQTPVLDALARGGVRLTRAYANSAVCSATRTALITGRYQDRLPVGLEEPVPEYSVTLGLPPSQPTLPSLFKRLGYDTALVGKWHLGAPPRFGPLKSGYDHFFGFYQGAMDYFTHGENVAPDKREPYAGLYEDDRSVTREGYLTTLFADDVVRRIGQRGTAPFFISLHFNAPHWPWEDSGDRDRAFTLKGLRDYGGGSLQKYGEMVREMDAAIGRVLDALQRSGAADDTIVVFTSDNGGERYSDVWPFIGMKGELLEGGLRIPAIVRWPGRIAPGSTCDQVTASMDWLPTLLDAAGSAPDSASPSDGHNVLPQLEGAAPVPRKLFWRYKANDQAAVLDGQRKYLKIADKEYLFDVVADQHERANLKDAQPDVFHRLKADYAAWNRTMLQYPAKSFSETPKGRLADRY